MDRLFLDANVIFSAAYRSTSGLQELWRLPGVMLLSSEYAIEEARRNLLVDDPKRKAGLRELLKGIEVVAEASPGARIELKLDQKDVPILLAAIHAGATHLLTGDKRHFGSYFGRRIRGVLVQLPGDYLGSIR